MPTKTIQNLCGPSNESELAKKSFEPDHQEGDRHDEDDDTDDPEDVACGALAADARRLLLDGAHLVSSRVARSYGPDTIASADRVVRQTTEVTQKVAHDRRDLDPRRPQAG